MSTPFSFLEFGLVANGLYLCLIFIGFFKERPFYNNFNPLKQFCTSAFRTWVFDFKEFNLLQLQHLSLSIKPSDTLSQIRLIQFYPFESAAIKIKRVPSTGSAYYALQSGSITFETVEEIRFHCDHSPSESHWVVLSCGAVCYAV